MTTRALRTSVITVAAVSAVGIGAYTTTHAFADHTANASAAEAATAEDGEAQVVTAAADDMDADAVATVAHAKRAYIKTVKLASKGHTAKVYKLGKTCFQADVLYGGKKIATINAFGKTANANLNGLHVSLTKTGKVSSWVEKGKPAPKPKPKPKPKPDPEKRQFVRTDTLADGSTAKIYKLSTNHFQAVTKVGTLDADGRSAAGEHNGMHVVLSPDGGLTSWMDDSGQPVPNPEPTPDPEPTPEPDPVVPDDQIGPDDQVKPDPQPERDTDVAPKPKPDTKPAPVDPSTDPGEVRLNSAA
ncbi:hypothetical protein [Streptomyces indicus]|nr:hypothetical protein [Streptomyces indicus]